MRYSFFERGVLMLLLLGFVSAFILTTFMNEGCGGCMFSFLFLSGLLIAFLYFFVY